MAKERMVGRIKTVSHNEEEEEKQSTKHENPE